MAGTQDKISVRCACGDTHEFARLHVGRVARCPKLNRRFRVPEHDSAAVFLDEAGPAVSPNESTRPESKGDSSSVGMGGRLVKRAADLYDTYRQRRKLHEQMHCRCPHCNAENLTADFMCAKCGCPLHDQQQAFLFMEKRRQEAHDLKVAQAGGPRLPEAPARLERGHVPHVPSVNVHMPRRTSSLGVVSLILGVIAFFFCWIPVLGILSIPLSALGLLLAAIGSLVALVRRGSGIAYPIGGGVVSGLALLIGSAQIAAVTGVATAIDESQRRKTRTNQEVVGSGPPTSQERPATEQPPAPESAGDSKGAEPEWASAKSPVRQGDVEVRITSVFVGKVPLRSRFDGRVTTSQDDLLAIHLGVTNRSQSKKVEYRSWLGRDVLFTRDYATLKDNFGNGYKRISFGYGADIIGHAESASIYPGKELGDVLIFEIPVDAAEYLDLELPARNFGGDGMLRIRIPAEMIRRR